MNYDREVSQNDGSVPCDTGGLDRLADLARLALEAGAPKIAKDAGALAERLAGGRFYVACVGQFKRGKSTLLNALIGEPLLPAGVVPITAALTVLRYAERTRARVRLGGEWREIRPTELAAYVSEERNPANVKHVELVEVFVPSPLLASGLCLVDTPGIGSVIVANSAATQAFIPHIDAALVVIGADPPITGEEMSLIEEVDKQVDDLVFVLSKADRLSEAERTEAIAFARKVLAQRLGKLIGPIFEVSAVEHLRGERVERDWPALEQALDRLGKLAGADLVRRAEARGVELLVGRLLYEIGEQHDALRRPVAESEARIRRLRACVADAEVALNDLGYLFTAEQERLHRTFEERCRHFLAMAQPAARDECLAAVRALRGGRTSVRDHALRLARQIAVAWVDRWLTHARPAAEQLYREAAARFVRLANQFLERMVTSGEALTGLPSSVTPDLGFRTASRLYYTDLIFLTGRSPLRWLLDCVRTPGMVRRAMERDALEYLEELLSSNATRAINDLDERVLEGRRRLEAEIHDSLNHVAIAAERALERARARHAAGHHAVEVELVRLDTLRQQTASLRTKSGPPDADGHAPEELSS